MNIVSLIQPSELGSDFRLEAGIWHVNFPTTATPPPPISNDARNIITNIADGMYIDKRNRLACALVQDNTAQKIRLYQFPADEIFNVETATLASEIDMLAMNGQFDDIAIDEGVITFTDVQTGSTLTLNTNELQRVGSLESTNTVTVAETAGVLRLTARIDPSPDNLLKTTSNGLEVSREGINAMFQGELAANNIHAQAMVPTNMGVAHVIGDQITHIPKLQLVNSSNQKIAVVNDPDALVMSSDFEYPSEVIINNNLGDGTNGVGTNFSLIADGVVYLASKPNLADEEMTSLRPDVDFYCYLDSSGVVRFRADSKIDRDVLVKVVLSPSEEQKTYSNKFEEFYRDAVVRPNGDFEFTLLARERM